jgi:hypothetical protein
MRPGCQLSAIQKNFPLRLVVSESDTVVLSSTIATRLHTTFGQTPVAPVFLAALSEASLKVAVELQFR